MKVYPYNRKLPLIKRAVVTLGTFDGVHLGHQKIIRALTESAKRHQGNSVVVTFDRHPQTVIQNRPDAVSLLTTLDEKIKILDSLNVDAVCILPFTEGFSRSGPETFLKEVFIDHMEMVEYVIGQNHTLGHLGKGDQKFLIEAGKRLGFSVRVVDPVQIMDISVSSTKIRQLLCQGEIRRANQILGRNYSLIGTVKKGKGVGAKKLGVPTANLALQGKEQKLIPGNGIYAALVYFEGEQYQGVGYIGTSPTLDGDERQIEIHLHGFEGNLYDQELQVEFVDFIRKEKKFDNIDVMLSEISRDKKTSLEILSKITGGIHGVKQRV